MVSETLPPGSLLAGKYRVEREIGSGGMGVVLEATHTALEQRVAIKVLNERFAQSPEMTARFLREARIAAKLRSDHIARVSDVGQLESGAPYIVMELLVGHDLETEIQRRGALPVSEAVDLILQASQGVGDAHAIGLVHRDLKPANLFLARRPGRPPIVKVLDFGLSKEAASGPQKSLTGDSTVFGTPQYMSPEQVHSAKNVDARSDQHALAMILFELLTGRSAFVAESVTALIVVIATHPPPSAREARSEVPPELDRAILRALAKRPDQRFPDLAAFAEAIAPFGSAGAREIALSIRASLESRGSLEPDEPRPSSAPMLPSDQLVTSPLAVGTSDRASSNNTETGLTSSVDFLKKHRRKTRLALAGGAAAIAVVAAVIAVSLMGGDPEAPPESAATSAAPNATGAVVAPPIIAPTTAEPSSSARDPRADASASAAPTTSAALTGPKKVKTPVTKSTKPTPSTSMSSVIGVFGDRKK